MQDVTLSFASEEQIKEEMASRGVAVVFFSIDLHAMPIVECSGQSAALSDESRHAIATSVMDMTMAEGIPAAAERAVARYLARFIDENFATVAEAADVAISPGPNPIR